MQRFLRNTSATLVVQLWDGDEPAAGLNFDSKVIVTDSAGVAMDGSPFTGHEDPGRPGTYLAPIAPVGGVLDTYEVRWVIDDDEDQRDEFEVVGGFMFAVAELRAFASQYANETAFPAAAIMAARDKAETRIEHAAGCAFRPRGRRLATDGSARDTLMLPDPMPLVVVEASIDGTPISEGPAALQLGVQWLRRPSGAWWGGGRLSRIQVLYEHGYAPTPSDARHAAILLAIDYLRQDARPSRSMGEATSAGISPLTLPNPGRGRSTGIPDVDAVIAEYGMRVQVY